MRPRGQPLAGAEGIVETETAQTPRSVRGSSVGAITSSTTSSKGEYSPVRQSSGNGWSPATPRMVASTPPSSSLRNSPRQTSSTGTQNRGGVSKASGGGFGTAPSSGGPGRTPQTRRKEFSLQQGSSDNRYTSPSGSPRASATPRVTNNTTNNSVCPSGTQTKRSRQTEPVRKTSTTTPPTKALLSKSTKKNPSSSQYPTQRSGPPAPLDTDSQERSSRVVHREKTKFDDLWDCKTIEHGLIRIPTHRLEDLIRVESIDKFYEVEEKPVASGLFATVRKCTHRETGIMYAAKFSSRVRCGVDCSMEILHEIAMLSACVDSNRIVHLKDVFQNKHEIILVLEYAPGGDFQSVLDEDMVPFEEDVQGFLRQILEALEFIHDRSIAHLDIKPQNIVLMGQFPNCEIKLCDLEVARLIQDEEDIREIIGTPDYVAPEILTLEPISLAADIWSLGVVAYVLLTGFSPFGGDTDQETLRNITSAELDFPDELFEGVSEEAKNFVAMCLNRDPKKRPTVRDCLQHEWIADEAEPPSPSPLMLKIPAPDPLPDPIYHLSASSHSGHSGHGGSGHFGGSGSGHGGSSNSLSSRRSCQTCRDKITERKRYLSKSREAIFEKVANSNLKKSLSKSRERLCDMRLTLSKSRDHLHDLKTVPVRTQDRLFGFRCLSKSQEVLSSSLGGAMKRMVNGAVSDISHAFLGNPSFLNSSVDVVIIPDGSVIISDSATAEMLGMKSATFVPIGDSVLAKPGMLNVSNQSVDKDILPSPSLSSQPLIEVSEEEEDPNRVVQLTADQRMDQTVPLIVEEASCQTNQVDRCPNKEEKDLQNHETKLQSLSRSASVDDLAKRFKDDHVLVTADHAANSGISVGIQVNLSKSISSPSLRRRLAERADLYNEETEMQVEVGSETQTETETERQTKEPRRRGFSHDHTLGEEKQCNAWKQELDKIRSQKHLRVTELIGTFNRNKPPVSEEDSAVKQRRRASLQIQYDSPVLGQLSPTDKAENQWLKAQRRKSTSSILTNNIENLKIQEQINDILSAKKDSQDTKENVEPDGQEKSDSEKKVAETKESADQSTESGEGQNKAKEEKVVLRRSLMDKVAQRKKNWDYFEIDHPKAISDQRLEQLKAKYQRRRTENDFGQDSNNRRVGVVEKIVEEEHDNDQPADDPAKSGQSTDGTKMAQRSQSVPLFNLGSPKLVPVSADLDLSVDPLTGLWMDGKSSFSSDTDRDSSDFSDVQMRKLSSDSDSNGSRRSSRSSRRKSSHLADIQCFIPEEKYLEVRIDPLTSQVETLEVARTILPKKQSDNNNKMDFEKRRRLSVEITLAGTFMRNQPDDDGFGSLPHTPTDLKTPLSVNSSTIVVSHNTTLDDGIFTSSEEVLDDHSLPQNGDPRQKACTSLDGDRDRGSWGDEIRPSSAQANPVSRMCTGAFSRALVKLSGDCEPLGRSVEPGLRRRQSSPVFRVSQ